jgi:hypothetical protein
MRSGANLYVKADGRETEKGERNIKLLTAIYKIYSTPPILRRGNLESRRCPRGVKGGLE